MGTNRLGAVVLSAMALALCGCGDAKDGRQTGSSGIGSMSDSAGTGSGGTAGSADGSGAETASDDGSGGSKFDIGQPGTAEGPSMEEGCQAVDFLFVIDNSVSMENEQAALVGAFPGFMAAIESTLAADSDYHIMITDTDEWGRCNTGNGNWGMDPSDDTCNNYIKNTTFEECDRVRGAGVLHPAGQHASNMQCAYASGKRYIEPGEPDLATAFSCAAQVGAAGHPSERPMDSLVAALSPALNGAGGCNDGFLRPDALLVVAFMSDDPNYEDTDGPMEWFNAIVAAKGGDASAAVILGLTPNWDGCQDGRGPPKGQHWTDFLTMLGGNGLHGNVCGTAQEYVDFFEAAVATIDQACDNFVPPG